MNLPALPSTAAALLLLALAPCAGAQSTAPRHHAHSHAAKTAAAPAAAKTEPLPPGVSPVAGPVQTLFALRFIDIQPGTGELVSPGEFLTVHYTGWLASDGTKFDSSLDRGEPFTFPQGAHRVIPGWDQGFTGMRVGGKRRLFIPYQLAYGDSGRPPVIPPMSNLIFDIELLAASPNPPGAAPEPPTPPQTGTPPGTPPEPAKPPAPPVPPS